MTFWLICPKCLDAFKGRPGDYCSCGVRAQVAPLIPPKDYEVLWEEVCLDGIDVEVMGHFKNKYYNCTIYVYCDGETHFGVDRNDEFLFASPCEC
jgi:hypothetical protein